jgi:hypothetical protein
MTAHTPTPWDWMIHDHSMASLGVMPDPGLGNPLVLAVSPCPSCADRAEPREWKWGRCHTPSEADAQFILTAVNSHYGLLELAAEAMWKRDYPNGGSIYKTYESLSLQDKELHREEALKTLALSPPASGDDQP